MVKSAYIEQTCSSTESKLEHYKKDIDELKSRNESLSNEIAILKPREEYLAGEKTRLDQEIELASEKITLILREKAEIELISQKSQAELVTYKEFLNQKDATIEEQRS